VIDGDEVMNRLGIELGEDIVNREKIEGDYGRTVVAR